MMKKKWVIRFISITLMMFSVNGVLFAQAKQSPANMIQSIANRLTNILSKNKSTLASSRADTFINNQVETIIVPKVNVTYMAQSVVGRYYWGKASVAERRAFVQEFKQLVILNYSAALASYDDDKVSVDKLLPSEWKNKTLVTVKSSLARKNGQRISINYDMSYSSGKWRINDFIIENISMADNYRSQFSNTLAQGGLGHLVTQLTSHNQKIKQ